MMYPMLNTRKPVGQRGEGMVADMRGKRDARGRRGGATGLLPSKLHVSQTGTVSPKQFAASRKGQPVIGAPALGGLHGFRMASS